MQLIEKFHKMESESSLFDLGRPEGLPIWDVVRYNVYLKYYYPEADRVRLEMKSRRSFIDFFLLIKQIFLFFIRIPFFNGQNIVFTSSRYISDEGLYFDKSAMSIINSLGHNYIIVEPNLKKKLAYSYFYDFSNFLRRFNRKKLLSMGDFERIEMALNSYLDTSQVTYSEINQILVNFKSDYIFFKRLFSFMKTKRIFIATGNPKAHLLAARELNIAVYLLQHASIEIDEIDYSYPMKVKPNSQILFPEYLLTLGNYWCKDFNVPAKEIIPIGNDFFYNKPNELGDNSILVISTIVHGEELKRLTKQIANLRHDLKFKFKLHPNEYHFKDEYLRFFETNCNVEIVTNEVDINILISKCDLVILIVSAVLYEALNQNKKVAIYKRINFERQMHLSNLSNVFLFDSSSELLDILEVETVETEVDFYKPADFSLIRALLE